MNEKGLTSIDAINEMIYAKAYTQEGFYDPYTVELIADLISLYLLT